MNNLESTVKKTFNAYKHNIKDFPDFFILEKNYNFWIECKETLSKFDLKRYKKTKQYQILKKLEGFLLIYYREQKYYEIYDTFTRTKTAYNSIKAIRSYFEEYPRLANRGRKNI